MKYYEGIDYWVRRVAFPNMASESTVVSHGDGTFTIYINTLFSDERQRDRLAHEIKHLTDEHFYRDDLSITTIEHQADGAKSRPDVDVRVLPGRPPVFSVFRSNDLPEGASFGFYVPDGSMRPVLKKNQLVYCDSQGLRSGDLALFQFKGNTILRQYYQDIFGVYLFALNRKNREDDLFLLPDDLKDLICLGRLMIKKKHPLPAVAF